VHQTADADVSSPWSARETELLAVTLQLLQERGYSELTLDAVAATARASKATIYRRWPTKAALVLAAFSEGFRQVTGPIDTGSLRGDLLALGALVCEQARQHTTTMRAVLSEVSRYPALRNALLHEVVDQRRAAISHIMRHAAGRGEIHSVELCHEIWDLLPGYLVFRSIIPGRPPNDRTVQILVDDVVLPTLTRSVKRVEAQPLGYLLHRLTSALRSEVTATVLAPLGLSFPQYLCMRLLSHSPGTSSAELARGINVSPKAMNTVVRGLQKRGLVVRPAIVSSGRSLPIELSREGAEVLKRTDSGVRAAERHVLAKLGEQDRRDLRRLLATFG
jgi:AcrR family transcriptional regulator